MASFLITLLVITMAEMGDRSQLLCAVLSMRFKNDKAIIAGLVAATVINCAIATYIGFTIGQLKWMNAEALQMFAAFAYILGGVGMLLWNRPLDMLENWKVGVFSTSFLGLFILQIGDKSQFIIAANSANADHWIFVFVASIAAILLANVPAIIFKDQLSNMIPLKLIRRIGGIIITFVGVITMMSALRLFG